MTPIEVLSLGAGVQSSTLALMAARGAVRPMPAAAVFADTQAEPAYVYEWLEWLETQLPFPVHRVTIGSLAEQEFTIRRSRKSGQVYRRSMIPAFGDGGGIFPRKCTEEYKIVPLIRCVKALAGLRSPVRTKTIHVRQWMGISTDEASRMKASRVPWIEHVYPLIDAGMSRADCLAWLTERGYPRPARSACIFCPYHSDREWQRLKDEHPAEFHRAVLFERRLHLAAAEDEVARQRPYLHDSRIPLDRVQFNVSRQLNLFENECEGMCGI